MDSNSSKSDRRLEVVDFSFKEFTQTCVRKWAWFVASVIFFVGLAFLYVKTRQPVYERSEEILIKDTDSGGGLGSIADAFSSIGLVSSNTTVYNELISLKSPAVMQEVVRRLSLDMDYNRRGLLHPVTLYGSTLPYVAEMKDLDEQSAASFRMRLEDNGDISLGKFVRYTAEGKEKLKGEAVLKKGREEVSTPLGTVRIVPNPEYTPVAEKKKNKKPVEIDVSKTALQSTVEYYCRKVNGDLVDQDADVIGLSIKDVSVQRAVDVLDMILVVYNERWVEDKNKMAVATSAFIDERLRLIQQELGNVDSSIASYQAGIGSPDLYASAKISMEKEAKMEQGVLDLTNQLALVQFMKDFLDENKGKRNIIPANTGFSDPAIEKDIAQYNALLLARNSLVSNSSEKNPLVADYDARLDGMRESITRSVSNQTSALRKLVANASAERSRTGGKIAKTSEKALPLLTEERQQKVLEGLYLFLLQKREENELSQKFTADSTRVITPPMGSLRPVSPRTFLILAAAFLFGVFLPLSVIYIRETGNSKIRSKKDLENMCVPFAGEIPQVGKRGRLAAASLRVRKKREEKAPLSVVEEGKRDIVNEAFRVIRSNIEFMSGKGDGCRVVMITSFNPGSGKSFISYNLGVSFSLKKKRVLLIDCDLRHGSSSMYAGMPSKGVTDYLTGRSDDWRRLALPVGGDPSFSILPIGKIPPNPAEILENGRLARLIEEARHDYDYILLDCPPVNVVVDTQIVGQYADRTLFVVRAGLLERSALRELDEFYEEKKFKNMSVILNGTEAVHSRYYTYGNYQSYGD